jgi:hypothetical protein
MFQNRESHRWEECQQFRFDQSRESFLKEQPEEALRLAEAMIPIRDNSRRGEC